ncbi:MAG: hypothetical protein WD448_03740 [Woeseia sp.]
MNDETELRSRQRRVVLMVMASAFLAWQVPYMDAFSGIEAAGPSALDIVSFVGFIAWAAGLVWLLARGRVLVRRASPAVRSALEDELVKANRARAFNVGYVAAVGVAAVMFSLSLFLPVSGTDAAHVVLIAGVVTPLYAFAVLERINA